MREYSVCGSPVKNKLFIQSSLNESFDFVSINIGIEEVLCALDDIVNDSDRHYMFVLIIRVNRREAMLKEKEIPSYTLRSLAVGSGFFRLGSGEVWH